MKHNSPQGPQPTGVAIFGQFPVLWAWLSGEQILGLDLPGEWVLGLDLSLGGPLTPSSLLLLPHCCKYFNEMEKKKKKKKRKEKKMLSNLLELQFILYSQSTEIVKSEITDALLEHRI